MSSIPGESVGTRARLSLAPLFAFLCLLQAPGAALGQNMPLDDKARYERSLEGKVDDVLLRLLGPNQAQVVVQATMDFTRTEKVDMTSQTAENTAKENIFKWDSSSAENQMVAEYLLPGFPSLVGNSGKPENTTYQKQMLYPASFVKKLVVTVILNKDVPDTETQSVKNVVSEILSMDPARGDELVIVKAPFAPFWRTIWYSPESIGLVFKYGILTLMGIVAMVVVSIGFLKLAQAMNTMAKAQQGHQITMDLGKNLAAGGGGLPGGGAEPGALAVTLGQKEKEEEVQVPGDDGKVVIEIQLEKVPFLVKMMTGEDPANVALVAGHLPPEVRTQFLKTLPSAFASDVIINMAKIRFVEPEIILTLKDELERRMSGAVGGIDGVLGVLETVNLRAKRGMLEELRQKQPDLADEVRKHILMPEDLALFSERDFSLVLGAVKVEEWATSLFDLPATVKTKVKKQMAEKTWQMVEQSMRYGTPTQDKREEATERVMAVVAGMIKEGRIANPLEAPNKMIAGAGQAA